MPLEDLMWVEKYRPSKLDDLVNQGAIKHRLKLMLEKKEQLPHLLFAGPPGSGKTTTALIIAKQILGEHSVEYTLSLNASDERGIDIVRERVKTFARFSDRRTGVPYRIVILDECDEMCLDPDTRVLVGKLGNLKERTLRELLETHGEGSFLLPSFDPRGVRLVEDSGKIVQSGKAELFKITLEDGRSVTASALHPFFTVRARQVSVVRTMDLKPGTEVAEFSDKVLRCHTCSRPFYRQDPYGGYMYHFCSTACRNVFFGSISKNRTPEQKKKIWLKAAKGIRAKGVFRSKEYRKKRSEIAKTLVHEGKIPDPRLWPKFGKGQGFWLGRKLSPVHKKAISEGDSRFFAGHPEVRARITEKVRKSLLDPNGRYQSLVRSGFFKEVSPRAYLASVAYWKEHGFRSKTEEKMGRLLQEWGIPYQRERLVFSNSAGHKYPFVIDFLLGESVALLVNGCWWHVCPTCGVRAEYEKQRKNMEKDARHIAELERLGYKVVIVWEHELRDEASIAETLVPKVYQSAGVSGGAPTSIKHALVRSVEKVGLADVLNISVSANKNFILANGVLTHNTHDAQTALRRIMEETSTYTRFILVCNYSSGIIEPLQSRCAIFRFQRLDEESLTDHLKVIAKKEKLKVAEDGVYEAIYEGTQGDLRQGINMMQAASASGEITVDSVKSVTGAAVKSRVTEIMKLAINGSFENARTKMVELTRVYGIPERDFLRFANESLNSFKVDDMGKAVSILAEYDFRLVQGSQPELQLTAMLAQLAYLKKKVD